MRIIKAALLIILLPIILLPSYLYGNSLIHISADKVVFNHKEKTSVYSGNVILNQKEIRITAQQIHSKKTKDGDEITALSNDATPVIYQNSTENMLISADSIHYQQRNNTLFFKGNVVAITDTLHLKADKLTYNIDSKRLSSSAQPGKQVVSIIDLKDDKQSKAAE